MSGRIIDVHIGEVRISKNADILKAILGSCVGIGVLYHSKKIYGLAHCLLPKAPRLSHEITGRFVTQAVPSLLALMKIHPEDYADIRIVLAGGANMMSVADSAKLIGMVNAETALQEIKARGLTIVHQDLGGVIGRQIIIDAADGTFRVEKIPRLDQAV